MTFFDELGLRAAEQLEASVGAFVALASYKRLAAAEPPTRGKAALGALRCAIELGDDLEIEQALVRWADETSLDVDASGLAVRLLRAGRSSRAASVAGVELGRRPTAVAAYVAARIEDARPGGRPLEAWERAIDLASRDGEARILATSVARWLELVLFASTPPLMNGVRDAIIERARIAPVDAATPSERLLIARARLLSPSKFHRASALSMLVDLARAGIDSIRRSAILCAAAHADASGGRLEPVEVDRVRTALTLWPDEKERADALARFEATLAIEGARRADDASAPALDGLLDRIARDAPELSEEAARVRAFLRGGAGARASEPTLLEVRLFSLGVDAVTAMARGSFADAARALVRGREALAPVAVVPPVLHAASLVALEKPDAALEKAAAELIVRSIERSFSAPPGGFLPAAVALVRAGFFREGRAVLAEARRLREPGAAGYLAEVERHLAYDLLRRGDRRGALEGLRAARSLFDEAKS